MEGERSCLLQLSCHGRRLVAGDPAAPPSSQLIFHDAWVPEAFVALFQEEIMSFYSELCRQFAFLRGEWGGE